MAKYASRLAFLVSLIALAFSHIAHAQRQAPTPTGNTIPVYDLGKREQGRSYPLKLTAKNIDCDTAQNFEFEIDSTPWLTTPNGVEVPGLGPGQSKSIKSVLDFTYTPPGIYYGRVTSRCTSCGWFIFAACVERGQDLALKVTVVDPSDEFQGARLPQTPNPYANVRVLQPTQIALNPRISRDDEALLANKDRQRLINARSRVERAQVAGVKARDALRAIQKKKSDCERELARLKAAAAAALRRLGIAKQDAANAAGAAKQAAKQLANFDKDRRKAEKARDRTVREAKVMEKYIADFCKGGSQGRKCKNFLRQVGEYQKKADAAKAEYDKISNSQADRRAAAEKTIRDAEIAKANVTAAEGALSAAQAAYNAKARECGDLTLAKQDAETKLVDAENAAKHTVGVANYEEGEAKKRADKAKADARAQGILDLEDQLKKKKDRCKNQRELMAAEVAKLKRALEVGQKLKIFDDDGGKRANMLEQVNDKLWDAAQDLAQDHTFATTDAEGNLGAANDDTAGLISLDTAEDIASRALFAMESLMDHLSGRFRSGGVPGVGQDQMLGGLKALALAVQSQVTAIRNPNTLAAMRNESPDLRRNAESYQAQKMKDMGIGKNAAERADIQKDINKIFRSPKLIANLIQRSGEQAAKCALDIKNLEAKLRAAKQAQK